MESEYIEILKNGGIGILPTDTIYGLVGCALDQAAVNRIKGPKQRPIGKGFIILISSLDDLKIFGVEVSDKMKETLKKFWPGKVSIKFDILNHDFDYLIKDDGTIAFRLPDKPDLIEILKQTGPLIAPSANPAGLPPSKNIAEARAYFGDSVDFYADGGELVSEPSTLIKIAGDRIEILRPGAVHLPL